MIAEKVKYTNIGVGSGFVLQILGSVLSNQNNGIALISWPLILSGLALIVWGCFNYAEGKGYSKYLGLLGLANCLGLIILIFLPDQCKDGRKPGAPINYGGPQTGVWPPPPNDNNEQPKQ